MFEAKSIVHAWVVSLESLERVEDNVEPLVSVDVIVDIPSVLPLGFDRWALELGRHHPFALVAVEISGRPHAHQL